jgi:hypothetical protein
VRNSLLETAIRSIPHPFILGEQPNKSTTPSIGTTLAKLIFT